MPVSQKIVTECVDRMVRLPASNTIEFGTKAKDIRDDLARAIQKHARTDEHARKVADEIMDACKFRPTPADVREYCNNVSENLERERKLPPCEVCCGNGWETRRYLVTYRGNSFQIIRSERLHLNAMELSELRATLYPPDAPPSTFQAQDILTGAARCEACAGTGRQRAVA